MRILYIDSEGRLTAQMVASAYANESEDAGLFDVSFEDVYSDGGWVEVRGCWPDEAIKLVTDLYTNGVLDLRQHKVYECDGTEDREGGNED